jgi:hypothetical protein
VVRGRGRLQPVLTTVIPINSHLKQLQPVKCLCPGIGMRTRHALHTPQLEAAQQLC